MRHVVASLVLLPLLFASLLARAASDIVVIDDGEPAYTVFAGLPAEHLERVRAKLSGQPGTVVAFPDFAASLAKLVAERVVLDEYPGARAAEGIVELVRKYPGTPFGLTWNGGIAFTRNDYEHAKRQYAVHRRDPDEYRRTRPAAPAADPVHPAGHLKPLLGW